MRCPKTALIIAVAVSAALAAGGCRPHTPEEPAAAGQRRRLLLTVLAGQSTSDPGIEEMIGEVVSRELPEVDLYWDRMDWGEQFNAQMKYRFAAGEIPDIMIGKAQDVSVYAPTGNLAPFSEELTSFITADALPAVTRGGQVYGIPYNAFYQGVLYNQDIFEEHHLHVPETRGDLEELVDVLTNLGITPFAAHFEENWYTANIFMQFAINNVLGREPGWSDRFRNGEVSFANSPEIRDGLLSIRYVLDHSWPDAFSVNQIDGDARFAAGEAAMYLSGSWSLQQIAYSNPGIRLGIFPYPNPGGDASLIRELNLTFMKSAVTSHPDGVDRVLKVVLADRDLAYRIFEYTKTTSLLRHIEPEQPLPINTDVEGFAGRGMVVDAELGNSQLIWSFQEDFAEQVLRWLRGASDLETVLEYADRNSQLSAP